MITYAQISALQTAKQSLFYLCSCVRNIYGIVVVVFLQKYCKIDMKPVSRQYLRVFHNAVSA